MADGASGGEEERGSGEKGVPDSFCRVSTMAGAGVSSSRLPPVPPQLRGRHLTARLQAGDLLYLPASWFHEVVSRGVGPGGHMALNLWLAPPHAGGSADRPYEDGFWEAKYQALREAALREEGRASPRARRRKGATKAAATGMAAAAATTVDDRVNCGVEATVRVGARKRRLPSTHRRAGRRRCLAEPEGA